MASSMRVLALTLGLSTLGHFTTMARDDDETLVDRFLARVEQPLNGYRGRRHLEARNARFNVAGWLQAETTLVDGVFSYRVTAEGGSAYVRNKVLRTALDGERDLIARGEPATASFTPANYDLSPGPASPSGELMLLTRPRRKDVLLINGALVVTEDGDLVRVEGRLAKSPSFWTRDVTVVRAYGRVNGIRVPVTLESTAKVRIAGTSTLTMRYEYDEVNGNPVTVSVPADAVSAQAETATDRR